MPTFYGSRPARSFRFPETPEPNPPVDVSRNSGDVTLSRTSRDPYASGTPGSPPETPSRANARLVVDDVDGDEERPAVVLERRRRRRERLRRQTPRRRVRRRASLRGDVAVPSRRLRAAPRSVGDDAAEFQPDEDVHEL